MRRPPSFDPSRIVTPRLAATVVLVRPSVDGLEVLLTRRPSTMAFAADVHVFPGGAVDAGDATSEAAALRELEEEVGIRLAGPEALVPIARWITPAPYPRRFDARFFVAELPPNAAVAPNPGEVADYRWIRPAAALREMAAGRLAMWLPTSTTLQQLEHARSIDEIRDRIRPSAPPALVVDRPAEDVVRFVLPAAGAVPGQTGNAYLVGRRELVLVDPGDPAPDVLEAILDEAAGRIRGIALTHADADHHAGADAAAERLGVPVFVGPRGARCLPYAAVELEDGATIPAGDRPLRAVATPGPRPEHVVLDAGSGLVISGDLVGPRASKAILAPPDTDAWPRSLERLQQASPRVLLPGHGEPVVGR